ncbi:hypothetical protein B0H65DRAFT_481427 [Neurospora tetraspora]|uniref:Uncharacterized protein n=1 Tax=Neurospora tetraspora TaxID=94610 RepID=A0AAE0IZQ3_9PEZI|nr:hypothetical protein B0H65DRAFT_481427 [Neurospora tetraspora]
MPFFVIFSQHDTPVIDRVPLSLTIPRDPDGQVEEDHDGTNTTLLVRATIRLSLRDRRANRCRCGRLRRPDIHTCHTHLPRRVNQSRNGRGTHWLEQRERKQDVASFEVQRLKESGWHQDTNGIPTANLNPTLTCLDPPLLYKLYICTCFPPPSRWCLCSRGTLSDSASQHGTALFEIFRDLMIIVGERRFDFKDRSQNVGKLTLMDGITV